MPPCGCHGKICVFRASWRGPVQAPWYSPPCVWKNVSLPNQELGAGTYGVTSNEEGWWREVGGRIQMKTWTSWDDHLEQTTASFFIATILSNVFYNHICFGSFICHQFVVGFETGWRKAVCHDDRQTSAGIVHIRLRGHDDIFLDFRCQLKILCLSSDGHVSDRAANTELPWSARRSVWDVYVWIYSGKKT